MTRYFILLNNLHNMLNFILFLFFWIFLTIIFYSSNKYKDSKISIDFTIQNGIVFVLEVKDQNKIAQLLSFVAAVDSS